MQWREISDTQFFTKNSSSSSECSLSLAAAPPATTVGHHTSNRARQGAWLQRTIAGGQLLGLQARGLRSLAQLRQPTHIRNLVLVRAVLRRRVKKDSYTFTISRECAGMAARHGITLTMDM